MASSTAFFLTFLGLELRRIVVCRSAGGSSGSRAAATCDAGSGTGSGGTMGTGATTTVAFLHFLGLGTGATRSDKLSLTYIKTWSNRAHLVHEMIHLENG